MDGLEAAVKNAIGLDSARGDRITMTAMPFEIDPAAAVTSLAPDSTKGRDMLVVVERFTRPGIMVLGIVAALVLGLKLLKPVPVPAGELAAGAASGTPLARGAAFPEIPDAPPSVSLQLRNRVQSESADSPNTAAQVMRAWLAES
jgi:flagellar biosynthesis/type III secretory pathway M-ring protein FliF/YscJ